MNRPSLLFVILVKPGFYKVAENKTQFANWELCDIVLKKIWRRLELKAENRHEKISKVAYCHSAECSFNNICISGISWVDNTFKIILSCAYYIEF